MTAIAVGWSEIRSHMRVPVLRAGYSLVASSITTSALGAIYWFIAAHRFDTKSVGIGSSLVAVTSLLGGIANLGLKNGLLRFVPEAGRDTGQLILRSYALSVLTAFAVGGVFLAGIHVWSPSLAFLRDGPGPSALFLVTLAAWAVFVLQDSVLIGIGRAPWVLSENVVFSVAKIAMLVAIVAVAPNWRIFLSWGVPTVALIAIVNVAIARRWLAPHAELQRVGAPATFTRVMRFSLADHAATLLWMATLDGIPLLVLRRSGPSAAAYYYLAAQIAYGLYVVSGCIGAALLAEAARRPSQRGELTARAARQAFGLVLPTTLAVVLGAPWALRLFGADYARNATVLLRLLALSAIPYTVTSLALSRARVQQRMTAVVAGHGAIFILCVGGAALLLEHHGLAGVGAGVLAGQTAVALVVLGLAARRRELVQWPGAAAASAAAWIVASLTALVALLGSMRNRLRHLNAARRLEGLLGSIEVPEDLRDGRAQVISAHNDVVIARLRSAERSVVIKVASGRRARRGLGDHVRALQALRCLHGSSASGGFASSIPTIIDEGTVGGVRYVIETSCAGDASSPALLQASTRTRALAAVDSYVGHFHALTAQRRTIEEALVCALVDRPLEVIEQAVGGRAVRLAPQLAAIRLELRGVLLGRRAEIGRVHGDLTPGNVLLDRTGLAVTGLVDWECTREDGLPDIDRAMFVMALRREQTGAELGAIVLGAATDPAFFDADERGLLRGRDSVAPLSVRHQVLLAWLSHVESNLVKSERYGRSHVWMRRNVTAVVAGLSATGQAGAPHQPTTSRRATAAVPVALDRLAHIRGIRTAALLAGVVALWLFALGRVNVRSMTDLGLVSVMPWYAWFAVVALIAAVVHALTRPSLPERRLLALLSGYLLLIHGTAPVLYQTLRYSWAWKHVGIIDYIDRHGTVDPHIRALDVYHNWPGFFSANAALVDLVGTKNAVVFAMWAPVASNLLNLVALLLLLPVFCADRRVVWTAAWLFFLGNWVGQDYFSPQAMAYFLYLVVLALLFLYFHRNPAQGTGRRDLRLIAAAGLTIVSLALANISSHQLTPAMMLIAMGALLATRRIRAWWVVAVTLLGQLLWLVGPARTFAAKNLRSTLASFGAPVENAGATMRDTARQSAGQAWVSLAGRAVVASIVVLALVGLAARLRRGQRDGSALVLLCAPALLVAANDFGGEILFRAYLFAMPFLALFGAWALVAPTGRRAGGLRTAVLSTVSLCLFGGFLLAHFGKDRSYHFSKEEVAAATFLDRTAESPTLLVEGNRNYPAQFLNYERFVYVPISEEPDGTVRTILADPVNRLEGWLADSRFTHAYVLITRSQKADVEAEGNLPRGSLESIESALRNSTRFVVAFENRDATIFTLAPKVVT